MFQYAGACYVAMPRHVRGMFPTIRLSTAAPVVAGTADAYLPFWDGLDLAVAVARGELAARCSERLENLRGVSPARRSADLEYLLPKGEVARLRVRVADIRYLFIETEVEQGSIPEGMSGAFLFQNDRPVGMAVQSDSSSHVRFIRIEEIVMNLNRWLGDRGAVFAREAEPQPVRQSSGFEVILEEPGVLPLDASTGPENLLRDEGDFVFSPGGVVELKFRVPGNSAADLSRITMRADPEAEYAMPLRVRISVAGSSNGRLRTFWSGQMGADGILDTGPRAIGTRARRIVVSIYSATAEGPVGIRKIVFE
ncbi:hypothetical protein N5A93_18490 [Roseovarius sp. EGI FJ00037]|uniref:hypothetical protein n=1 Tax=Roseovarius TaxID=74030 RepID=UPI0022A83C7D|nr:hypothetical protein [Roseovarius sp. EGI FJ00037]MCZ0814212.1 hypothetical protein [Roseovarius sp. EGI FJ00037]